MDKLNRFQQILTHFVQDYANESRLANMPAVETVALIDLKQNRFQALHIGWHNGRYIFAPVFHLDIKNEKIWLQCNNSEREIVDVLMEQGVAKHEIVLGFVPPMARHLSGFAEA